MDKHELDRYLSQSDEDAHPEWFDEHPEDQTYIRFPVEAVRFLTGDYDVSHEVLIPMFKRLTAEEESDFRRHARENYVVETEIDEVFHPVWRDEARRMNSEAFGGILES